MLTSPKLQRALMGTLVALLAAIVFIVLSRGSNSAEGQTQTHSPFDGPTMPAHLKAQDFTLTDQHGRRVSLAADRGKVVVLTFIHSLCHDTCPFMVEQIKGALNDLPGNGRGVPAIGVSVAPGEDTVHNRDAFLAKHEMSGRVKFGRCSAKIEPASVLVTLQPPPCALAIASVMASPRPTPPALRVRAESARANRSKIRDSASGGTPTPSSSTSIDTSPRPFAVARSSIAAPGDEYLTAFSRSASSAARRRSASTSRRPAARGPSRQARGARPDQRMKTSSSNGSRSISAGCRKSGSSATASTSRRATMASIRLSSSSATSTSGWVPE